MKWFLIMLSKALMWGYSFFVFPLAYVFREGIRANFYEGGIKKVLAYPLWITLNDEEDFWDWWYLEANGLSPGFITAWKWSYLRNNSWNWNHYVVRATAHQITESKNASEIVCKGWSTDALSPLYHRRFKWELKRNFPNGGWFWVSGYTINKGDRLSQKFSSLGTAFCTYKIEFFGFKSKESWWRFSHAGLHGPIMLNVKAGYNDLGEAILDIKIKRLKKEYISHWKK